jgi:hypothetical protein
MATSLLQLGPNSEILTNSDKSELSALIDTKADHSELASLATKSEVASSLATKLDANAIKVDNVSVEPEAGKINIKTRYKVHNVEPSDEWATLVPNAVNYISESTLNYRGRMECYEQSWNLEWSDDLGWHTTNVPFLYGMEDYIAYVDNSTYEPATKDSTSINMEGYRQLGIKSAVLLSSLAQINTNYNGEVMGFEVEIEFFDNITGDTSDTFKETFICYYYMDCPDCMFEFITKQEDMDGVRNDYMWQINMPENTSEFRSLLNEGYDMADKINTYVTENVYSSAAEVYLWLGWEYYTYKDVSYIELGSSSEDGVRDYILDITIPEGATDINILGSGSGFVSSNPAALVLEVGRNLLTFTEIGGSKYLVNRTMLKEVYSE